MSVSRETIINYLFFIQPILLLVDIVAKFLFHVDYLWVNPVLLMFPLILFFVHAQWYLGGLKSFLFFLTTSFMGFTFEVLGLKFGTVFGGNYVYNLVFFRLHILNVPIFVPVFWCLFIYSGYCMTNNVLEILNLRRLSAEKSKYQKWLPYLLLICFVDALLVTTIDLYMDPISVKAGAWTWLDRGIYFGVPLGNYIGWFFVTFVSSLIIRTLDYYFPSKSDIPDSLFLMPVYGLIFLWLSFTLTAIFYQLYSLVIVGTFVMLPIPLISVLMSWSWPKRISK